MDDIRAALIRAAGPDEPPIDLVVLRTRSGTRRQRKRAVVASVGAFAILGVVGLAWTASGPDGSPDQRLTAGQSVDDPSETTTSLGSSTSTSLESTTIPTSATTTTTAPVTAPPSTTVPGAGALQTISGTYLGAGRYWEPERNGCQVLSHKLDALFTLASGEEWSYHADYCGTLDGSNWSGEGNFTWTTPVGDTVTGSFTSKAMLPSKGVPYDLTVTGGKGAWAGAQGTCHLTNRMRGLPSGLQEQAGEFTCEIEVGAGDATEDRS